MTDEAKLAERARFEAWWIQTHKVPLTRFSLKPEKYLHSEPHMAWEGWQAATDRAWRPIAEAPKTGADYRQKEIEAWCPDPDAVDGGDLAAREQEKKG